MPFLTGKLVAVMMSLVSALIAATPAHETAPVQVRQPTVKAAQEAPPSTQLIEAAEQPVVDDIPVPEVIEGIQQPPAGDYYDVPADPEFVPNDPPPELSPEDMIRAQWAGTGDADTMVAIARRESGLTCDAKNPHSSAVGLFQTLKLHLARATDLGYTWYQVGHDCAASVALAWSLYQDSGTAPWRLTR